MPDIALPSSLTISVETLWAVLKAAKLEHDRLATWLDLGAQASFSQDATDLAFAITLAVRTVKRNAQGGDIPLVGDVTVSTEVAATLRYFASRELGRLAGLNAWFPDDDLDQQATELHHALQAIPYTLRRDVGPATPPSALVGAITHTTGASAHG